VFDGKKNKALETILKFGQQIINAETSPFLILELRYYLYSMPIQSLSRNKEKRCSPHGKKHLI
jgi:hypothetical protein